MDSKRETEGPLASARGERAISELYCAVTAWALSQGAKDLSKTPGLWHRKTEKHGVLGPLDVRINAHKETIDAVPFGHIMIGMDEYFPGMIALINPVDGVLLGSPRKGEDEAGLIEHFKAQTPVTPASESERSL